MTAAAGERTRPAARSVAMPRAGRLRSRRRRNRTATILRFVLALIVCLVMVFPFYWMVVVALAPRTELFTNQFRLWPSRLTLDNFTGVLAHYDVATWFGNSLVITAFVTVLGVAVNLLAGYAFAKLRFLGRGALFFAALATLVLPVQVTMGTFAGLYEVIGTTSNACECDECNHVIDSFADELVARMIDIGGTVH